MNLSISAITSGSQSFTSTLELFFSSMSYLNIASKTCDLAARMALWHWKSLPPQCKTASANWKRKKLNSCFEGKLKKIQIVKKFFTSKLHIIPESKSWPESFQKGSQGRHLTDSQAPGWRQIIRLENSKVMIGISSQVKQKVELTKSNKITVMLTFLHHHNHHKHHHNQTLPWIEHYCSVRRYWHCQRLQRPHRKVSTCPQVKGLKNIWVKFWW